MQQVIERGYYQSLYEVAAKVNSAGTPKTVIRYIAKKVAQATEAKGCSLMLLTPDKKRLVHAVAYGLSDAYIRKGPISVDKSIAEALAGKPVAVLYATEDERIQYRSAAEKEGIASILSVPVMLREEIIGVMRLYTAKPYHFTDDDIYFVGAAANLGAIALENARLYKSLEHEYETFRKETFQWQAALGDEWMHGDSVEAPDEITTPPPSPGF